MPGKLPISNLVDTFLSVTDTLVWSPGSIFQHTLTLRDMSGSTLPFQVKDNTAHYIGPNTVQTLHWQYRRFDTNLRQPKANYDSLRLLNNRPLILYPDERESISLSELQRDLGSVDYSGVFGRGLRFGNSQNLVLDSRLDLQLNGDLGEGLTVAAVVSDQNIPLQPEGNTVQLREFDRLFVTVARDEHSLTAGDYTLRSNRGHFIRFEKNLQGLSYRLDRNAEKPYSGQASIAASRGDFQRIQLPTTDGNQGPYRLTGSRGEPFIIVLAGTERVYLDGRLLERGIDRDYVIDYNRGELTFMPRLLINRFLRIIVEYEYSDREYLRTLASADAQYNFGRLQLQVQGLQQQDGLRRSGSALSTEAQRILNSSEGARGGVLVPSALPIEEGTANPIRYRLRIDSSICGVDSIYIFADSTTGEQAYTLTFTEVGPGNGNYELVFGGAANGATFRYVPPDSLCRTRGNYAPLRQVQTPRSLRLVTLGGSYRPDSSTIINFEFAGNSTDLNRFSPSSQQAGAAHLAASHTLRLRRAKLALRAHGEGTTDGFEAIAPWRSPEFRRLWNLGALAISPTAEPGGDWLAGAEASFNLESLVLAYGFDTYQQNKAYAGFRQNWQGGFSSGRLNIQHSGNVLDATRDAEKTGQSKLDLRVNRLGFGWKQSAAASRTTSQNYDLIGDQRSPEDRIILEWSARTEQVSNDSSWRQSYTYTGRNDALKTTRGNSQSQGTNHQFDFTLASPSRAKNALELTASYRHSDSPAGSINQALEAKNFYLGRLSHRFSASKKSWLRTQTLLEAGSGQERRVSVQYLRVQAGLGEYVWRDYNQDGQEQLDEFEVAVFADSASYLRTVLLTDDFVATNTLTITEAIDADLSRLAKDDKLWWSRLSASTNANLKRRALQSAGYTRLLAVNVAREDTSLVGDDLGWRNAVYLNRNRNTFRAEIEYRQLAVRGISLQGLQLNRTSGQAIRLQQPLGPSWRIGVEGERELRRSESETLLQRNFTTASQSLTPNVSFQPRPEIRAELQGGYRNGSSLVGGAEVRATNVKLILDLRVAESSYTTTKRNPFAGATFRASVERVQQEFEGDANSPLGFTLLEGLRPGESWVWSLTSDQQLGKALQLSIRYDGRQLGGGRIVHTGQAQLQAVF